MGAVYLARERSLDRLVAIKILLPEATTGDNRERFKREARTAAKLTHPNIVPLHSFGEAEGMLYFVMGFVHGETLKAKLGRQGKIDPEDTRRILGDIAGALHYAHEQGVVHRDIKPDNILIEDQSGSPLLTDFGVARTAVSGETLTQVGTTLGTPHYMSPEQASGDRDIDGRSDLYSLGVVGYHMVSGRLPFEGDNLREVLVQHVTTDPVPLKTLVPSAPSALARVISDCLAKDPGERPADGVSVQRALGLNVLTGYQEEVVPMELERHLGNWRGFFYLSGGLVLAGESFFAVTFEPGYLLPFALGAVLPTIPLFDIRSQIKKGDLKGYTFKEVLRWVFKQPRWWTSWWPRSLRRTADLWERYPSALKSIHKWFGAFVLGVNVAPWLSVLFYLIYPDAIWALGPTLVGLGAGTFWNMGRLYRQARAAGLGTRDARRLFYPPPPHSPFWQKSEAQRVLLPPEGLLPIPEEAVPHTPTGYLQALSQAAKTVDGPRKLLTEQAASAAREILRAIDAVDRHAEDLVSSSDPAEVARYKQRLEALGDPDDAEPASKKKMRDMLKQQLELAQGLADQLEEARERRTRFLDMLKTLWLQVASLKARAAMEDLDTSEISQQVRAIAEDVQRYHDASEEAENLLEVEE